MSITPIQTSLYTQLLGTGWDEKLRIFLYSLEMEDILLSLKTEVEYGKRFTPPLKQILTPFILCPLNSTKVVILAKEPWDDPTLNDGLALSHTNHLRHRFESIALSEELEKVGYSMVSGDLSSWAKQGVLMLNTTLTTQVLNQGKHFEIWRPFIYRILEILRTKSDLVWLIMGENPYRDQITSENVFEVASLPNVRNLAWDSQGVFLRINETLRQKNISEISW